MLIFKIINLCIFMFLLVMLAEANPVPNEEYKGMKVVNLLSDPKEMLPEMKISWSGFDYIRKLPEMARKFKDKLMGKKEQKDVAEPQTQSTQSTQSTQLPKKSDKKDVSPNNHTTHRMHRMRRKHRRH